MASGKTTIVVAASLLLKPLVIAALGSAFNDNPIKNCVTLVEGGAHPDCFTSVTWAKTTGIHTNPDYYTGYNVTENSSFQDFQCVLADQVGNDSVSGDASGSNGHGCPVPCASTMSICQGGTPAETEAVDGNVPTVTVTTTTASSGSSSFPWWAWLLLIAALLLVGAGVAFALMGGKKKDAAKKKKRGVKTSSKKTTEPEPAKAPETPAPAASSVLVAPPVYIQSASSFVATAMPATSYPAVAQYAQPITTISQAMPQAMPIQTAAFPVQQAQSYLIQQP